MAQQYGLVVLRAREDLQRFPLESRRRGAYDGYTADTGYNTDMEGVQTLSINEEMLQPHRKEDMVDSLMADSPMAVVNNTTLRQWEEMILRVGL